MPKLIAALTLTAALLPPFGANAAEPVRHIGIYVTPYYEATHTPDGTPRVTVGQKFDRLLASTRREDIAAARDLVEAEPGAVTPMAMMALPIRFYDVGLRDDAVFWFYVAKARYITLEDVVDTRDRRLQPAAEAIKNFVILAGPANNTYAYCDPAKQRATLLKALDWIERNPYAVLQMAQLRASRRPHREPCEIAQDPARSGRGRTRQAR